MVGKQPRSIFWSLHGHYKHYKVTTTFRFSFMNGSSFEPMIDHFGRVCVVAFQIRFRYVSNLVS